MIYVITAFVAPGDCQAISYGHSVTEALDRWQSWILNGEPLEGCDNDSFQWITKARSDLRNHGLTDKQDSDCHYRLEILYP